MRKHIFPLLFLFLISVLTHPTWFFNFEILTYGDFYIDPIERIKEYVAFPSIWQSSTSFGSVNIGLSFWPLLFFAGLLAKININPSVIERIIYFWPTALFSVFSMYILSYYVFRSRIAGIVSSLVYTFNVTSLVGQAGILTISTAVSIAPLLLFFFILTIEKKKIIYAVLSSLIAFILSFYEFRIFYLVLWIMVIYIIYYFLIEKKIKKFKDYTKIILLSGATLILPILLNIYWILGLSNIGAISTNEFFSRGLFGGGYVDVLKSLTLFIWLWTDHGFAGTVQPIPIYFWLIPLFAIFGLILNRFNKYVLFFGFIAIFGIFLVKQSNYPFTEVYSWLYKYLPGFNVFRESTKFYFYIQLGYSILIGAFIAWIWQNWQRKKWQTFGKYFLTLIIIFIFLWNTKPILTGKLKTVFVPREIPQDYLIVRDFIKRQPEYFRTFWVPRDPRWSFYELNHPRAGAISVLYGDWIKFTKEIIKKDEVDAELIRDLFSQKKIDNLLDLSSIKYIVIPIEDKLNEDDFFVFYGKNRQYYIDGFDKNDYLNKINIGTKDIVIYENKKYRPHLYFTLQKETINKNIPFQNIPFHSKNQTEYKIHLKSVSQPIFLNFSENYHPDWKIKIENFNWLSALINKNYFLIDNNHFQNDAGLNTFLIDPKYIKSHYPESYRQNQDGSLDLDLVLYFKSQSYIYIGSIISSVVLILSVGYVLQYLLRQLKKTYENE